MNDYICPCCKVHLDLDVDSFAKYGNDTVCLTCGELLPRISYFISKAIRDMKHES